PKVSGPLISCDTVLLDGGSMRKSGFTDELVVAIVREADQGPSAAVAKRHGVSEQTIYTWRKRFGTLQANDVHWLEQLGAEDPASLLDLKAPDCSGRATSRRED